MTDGLEIDVAVDVINKVVFMLLVCEVETVLETETGSVANVVAIVVSTADVLLGNNVEIFFVICVVVVVVVVVVVFRSHFFQKLNRPLIKSIKWPNEKAKSSNILRLISLCVFLAK